MGSPSKKGRYAAQQEEALGFEKKRYVAPFKEMTREFLERRASLECIYRKISKGSSWNTLSQQEKLDLQKGDPNLARQLRLHERKIQNSKKEGVAISKEKAAEIRKMTPYDQVIKLKKMGFSLEKAMEIVKAWQKLKK